MSKTDKFISLSLIIFSAAFIFLRIIIELFIPPEVFAFSFILYGLLINYFSFNNHNNFGILLGSVLFIAGVFIWVINNYDVLIIEKLLFPSLLFALGTSFLMIAINTENKFRELLLSMILFVFVYLSLTIFLNSSILSILNSFTSHLLDFWPSILFISGLIYLIRSRKNY